MTDSEKLDLILLEMQGMKQNMHGLEQKTDSLEKSVRKLEQRTASLEKSVRKLEQRTASLELKTDGLEKSVRKLEQRTASLELKTDGLEQKTDGLVWAMQKTDQKVTKIYLTIENELRVNIMRVAEGHLDLSRILHEAMKPGNELELLSVKVSMLENDMRDVKAILA